MVGAGATAAAAGAIAAAGAAGGATVGVAIAGATDAAAGIGAAAAAAGAGAAGATAGAIAGADSISSACSTCGPILSSPAAPAIIATRRTAATAAAMRALTIHPNPPRSAWGAADSVNDRDGSTSGSLRTSSTVRRSDSSSARHSAHPDKWRSTRRRSRSLNSPSM